MAKQLIFYDDNDMNIYNCELENFQAETLQNENNKYTDANGYEHIFGTLPVHAIATFEMKETPAELDPTTMKRIAKYNAEKEVQAVNEKIKDANRRLEELECELAKKQEKLEFIQTLTDMIIKDKNFTKEHYLPHNDDDDDYYDYISKV